MAGMTLKDAWLYAAQWGSYIRNGDPGACLYGFDESFRVQSESHRADCLEQMAQARAAVVAAPQHYDADELAQIDTLCERLTSAKLEGEPGALDGADDFTTGYVQALFFTDNAVNCDTGRDFEAMVSSDDDEPEGSFPNSAGPDDLAPDTLECIKADCAAFQTEAAHLLAQAYDRDGYTAARAGHDFWLTRNGHGAGFWDRSELEAGKLGDALSEVAKRYSQADSYFGDDGRIHI
jgi:hypothetical protein